MIWACCMYGMIHGLKWWVWYGFGMEYEWRLVI